ncbi:MAG: hypothetical protein JSV96_13830 [Candidatus Aminicenantes bacterium]|nr:MAG: hypothetical protein JSV96_13830 [Candidatus Aminicenantes bacterium]
MKIKNLLVPVLLLGLMLNLSLSTSLFAQEKKQEKQAQEARREIFPPEIKTVFAEGIQTRLVRPDILFSIAKHYYLPAQQNHHNIFLFKVKNADLGFAPIVPVGETPEKKEEKEKEEEVSAFQAEPNLVQANAHLFLQFNRLENGSPGELVKEVYIPFRIQEDGSLYKPDEEGLYSTGYPLPSGNYLLSMAITSGDLTKIGTQYFEFSTPNPTSFTDALDTTPIFFVKKIERMAAAETTSEVHKNIFTYSVLQIEPNIDNIFAPGEFLDIFFFVFGTQPKEDGRCKIEVNYQIFKEDQIVIRYEPRVYDTFPLVSQPLPMKSTVIIKSEEGEKTEQRDLEAGAYTLVVKITDMISGKSVEKKVSFEVR